MVTNQRILSYCTCTLGRRHQASSVKQPGLCLSTCGQEHAALLSSAAALRSRRPPVRAASHVSCEQRPPSSAMRTVLCVAEKNSAAKEIANVMCAIQNVDPQRRQGRNPVFEFPFRFGNQPCQVLFTAVAGHIKEPAMGDGANWGAVPHSDLLDTEKTTVFYRVSDDKNDLAAHLRTLSRRADTLVLFLDCDSEGEKIARDVADVCLEGRPSLTVRRAKFSAMTRQDIGRSWANLGDINARVVAMVEVRQELDMRAGWAFTRFLTEAGRGFDIPFGENEKDVLSYGPCQSPTLGLVVDRQLTIDNFKRRPFWSFRLILQGCDCSFEWARARLFEEYSALLLYELCVEDAEALGKTARVERVDMQNRSRRRPTPLSTIELQKAASRLLRMSSDRSVKAAEALYAKGLISYPRTETDEFENSYNLQSLVQLHTGHAAYGQFAARLMSPASQDDPVTFMWPRSGGSNDNAHPPIHPTAPDPGTFGDPDQKAVYEYVARRFLAACSIDAQGGETKVQVRVGRAELFGTRGLMVQVKGYLEVMRYEKWSDKKMPDQLMEQGASVPIRSLELQRSETQPPPLLSEADLISLMDRHGIGTDATIAQHVKKILDRNYAEKVAGERFKPTIVGIAVVEAMEKSDVQLARPGMRKAQEEQFKKIQAGTAQAEPVKLQALSQFRTNYDRLSSSGSAVSAAFGLHFQPSTSENVSDWDTRTVSFSMCGVCGRMMSMKKKVSGDKFSLALFCNYCPAPASYILARDARKKVFRPVTDAGKICPICNFQVINSKNTTTRKEHRLCPCCFQKPPSDLNPKSENPGNFRCFACSHSSCPNATASPTGLSDVARCPLCRSACCIRPWNKDNRSGWLVGCDERGCTWKAYFFPDIVEKVEPVSSTGSGSATCQLCGSKKLTVKLKESSVPPGFVLFTGCIWCGPAYGDFLRGAGVRGVPSVPHPGTPLAVAVAPDVEGAGRGHIRGRGRGRGTAVRRGSSGSSAPAPRGGRGRGRGRGRGA